MLAEFGADWKTANRVCQSPQERRANGQVFGMNQQEGKEGGTAK